MEKNGFTVRVNERSKHALTNPKVIQLAEEKVRHHRKKQATYKDQTNGGERPSLVHLYGSCLEGIVDLSGDILKR